MSRRTARLVVSMLLMAMTAGCGGGSDETDDAGDGAGTSSTTAAPTTPTTASTTATSRPPTTRPSPAEPNADAAACFDGDCEIRVATFPTVVPLDPSLGVSSITFESVGPDGVYWRPADAGAILGLPIGTDQAIGNLTLRLVAIEGSTALVHLSPA